MKNDIIKAAFEEAAINEINNLPAEDKIIRPYTDEFTAKMEKLFNEEKKENSKKRIHFTKVAVLVAVLMVVMFTFTASAVLLSGDGWYKLLNFTVDPEKYESVEVKADGVVEKEGDYDTLVYTGKPITVKYTVDTGESWKWPDRGIMVFLDGVRQTFDARVNDDEYKDIDMLLLENEQGSVRCIELTFEPNTGKKGDEIFLDIMAIFDPDVDYYIQCNSEHKELFVSHWDRDNDRICDKCSVNIDDVPSGPSSYTRQNEALIRVVMQEDAPVQTKITDSFSGVKLDELNKRIYESYEYEDSYGELHNDYDTMSGITASVYKNIKASYFKEGGVMSHSTRIKTRAKEKDEFTLNLHGATGKYRVSLYINNEIQNVFDGFAYADVNVTHGQQTELIIELDTTVLPEGDNYCYVLLQRLDSDDNSSHWLDCYNLYYTIEVK